MILNSNIEFKNFRHRYNKENHILEEKFENHIKNILKLED